MMEILQENFGVLILVLIFGLVLWKEHSMGKRAKHNPKMAGSILEALLNAIGQAGRKPKE